MQEHPELVEKVWENANYFKEELKKSAITSVCLKHLSLQLF